MLKIRKQILISFFAVGLLALQGCSASKTGNDNNDSLSLFRFGDTRTTSSQDGSEEQGTIQKEMYLDTELLNQSDTTEDVYNTYTVTRGDFVTTYNMDQGEVIAKDATVAFCEFEQGTMYFKEYCVNYLTYVEEGEPIAKVYMELDTTQLNELKLKLNRYEQRYQEAKDSHEEKEADYEERFQENMTALERLRLQQEYDNYLFQWEETCDNWEQTIEDTKEQITSIEETASITEILAPVSGVITNMQRLYEGYQLSNGYELAEITDLSPVYLQVDGNGLYSYGSKVQVTWKGNGSQYEGTVVSLDPKTASYDMFSTTAYIRVDCSIADIGGNRNASISIVTRKMKDVLLVDRAAVTEEDGIPYVTVRNEDGSLCKTGFTAGGYNNDYYWVYSGLSEGMQLVKKKS